MAGGGKETPRQKMIGMMYLFLTAMLAINVSDSLLHRFLFINNTLEQASHSLTESNEKVVGNIQTKVERSGNRSNDVAILNKADQVRNETKAILDQLDELKEELVTETGGVVDGELIGFKDSETIAHRMIKNGEGEELKSNLNGYVSRINGIIASVSEPLNPIEPLEDIAYDGADHPMFQNDPNQRKKEFSVLFFENTPLAAGLATLTQFENDILEREAKALNFLAEQVGAQDVKFDRVRAVIRPEAQRVAAGAKYRADLFIAASSSALVPTMTFEGKEIPVNEEGIGTIEFTASAGSYNEEGVAKKSYNAAITQQLPTGGDTTYAVSVDYFVLEPVIQIQSASVNALYYSCGNELTVQVPALGSAYNPSFRVAGGTKVDGDELGVVTIVPNDRNVTLTVLQDGREIGSQKFEVRAVPKPEIRITASGQELDTKRGLSIQRLSSLSAKAIPDDDFKRLLPRDARYRVAEWRITLAAGARPVIPPVTVRGDDANLSAIRNAARPGHRLVIEVLKVERRNFLEQTESVPVYFPPLSIPLN